MIQQLITDYILYSVHVSSVHQWLKLKYRLESEKAFFSKKKYSSIFGLSKSNLKYMDMALVCYKFTYVYVSSEIGRCF